MTTRSALSLMAVVLLLTTVTVWAADRLRWDAVTGWSDGTALTPAEQKALRYRIAIGDSPTTLVAITPDVTATSVLLSQLPTLTPGRYVNVRAVLGSVEGPMSNVIRYAAPGEVLGLAIESIP